MTLETLIKPNLLCSTRLNLAIVMFFGCVVLYSLRSNISFAIVCMVDATPNINSSKIFMSTKDKCESNFFKSDIVYNELKTKNEFSWSKKTQGAVLSAFFWGYMISQILGGYLAETIGAKRVVGVATFGLAILTILSPMVARFNVMLLIFLRVLIGFLQGTIIPAFHSMWALWAPPLERGILTGISYAGMQIGNALVMPLSSLLCYYNWDGGWPLIFYMLGISALIWCILWEFTVADSPFQHKFINEKEKNYIVNSLGLSENLKLKLIENKKTLLKNIFSSKAVWACFISHFASDWGAYTMATGLPLYMNDTLNLDLTSMGMLLSIPYLFYFLVINLSGYLTDHIQKKKILSTLNTRKLSMIIALGGQALFLIFIGYLKCGQELLIIIYLTASLGIAGFQYSGLFVNYLDICPTCAGTVLGIGQTISCLSGILSPLIMGYLTPLGTREEWQNVFFLTAFILILGTIVYTIFASAEVQSWAFHDNSNKEKTFFEENELKNKSFIINKL